MIRRVIITLDRQIESKIRVIQAKMISESNKAISFSNVINQILKEGLKDYYKKYPHTPFEFKIPLNVLQRYDRYGFFVGVYDSEKPASYT